MPARQSQRGRGATLVLAAALVFAPPAVAQKSSTAKKVSSVPARAPRRADVARFRARVQAALAEAQTKEAYWGILVTDEESGETLYELNADQLFAPASNAKLFTTAFALAELGPGYRFRTTLESQAALASDGRLGGDLILVGRGDPDLSNRKFPYTGKVERDGPTEKILAEMADAAVASGLKEVDGDIVADDSYFPYDPYPEGWTVGDLYFTFGAPLGALAFEDNSIAIEVSPGAHAGDPAMLAVEPAAAADAFGHEIRTVPEGEKPDFSVVRQPGMNFALLRGSIPLDHAPVKLELAMNEPAEIAARTLKQLLEARGVRVAGGIRVRHAPPPLRSKDQPVVLGDAPPTPANALVLAEHLSPPLLESVRLTNKVSQNLHAELFLRTIAREKTGVGSTDAGVWVERDFLKAAGIAEGDAVLSDGSGLSRNDLVTPRALVEMLRYAASQAWGPDFRSTLPVAGVDGTLEDRMKGTAAAGRMEAKSGALDDVRALSGYATTLGGEHLIFTIVGNNDPQRGRDATAALDAIAVAMVETLGKRPARKKK